MFPDSAQLAERFVSYFLPFLILHVRELTGFNVIQSFHLLVRAFFLHTCSFLHPTVELALRTTTSAPIGTFNRALLPAAAVGVR